MNVKIMIFWYVTPRSVVDEQTASIFMAKKKWKQ
jgi:hypothetical protein